MLCRFHESALAQTADGAAVAMGPQVRVLVDKLGKDLMRASSATVSLPPPPSQPPPPPQPQQQQQQQHKAAHIIAAAPAQACSSPTKIILPPSPPKAPAPTALTPHKPRLRPEAKEFVCCTPAAFALPDRLGLDLGD